MAKLSNAFLERAARSAAHAKRMQAILTKAFEERYGVTYSDVDSDWLIEVLDYGNGRTPTLADCDRVMTDAGHPPKFRRRLALQPQGDIPGTAKEG